LNGKPAFQSATGFLGHSRPILPSRGAREQSAQGREQRCHAADAKHNVGAMLLGFTRLFDQRLIPAA
jgi:hypothetical protein